MGVASMTAQSVLRIAVILVTAGGLMSGAIAQRSVARTDAGMQIPATYPPNEVGLIPILEYHAIGGEPEFAGGPRYDNRGLNVAPATFREHLRLMYAAGWYPVNMRAALSPRMQVPRGKIPVVITFDDARPTQFRYRQNGTIDPDCAVGILEEFHRRHPDWPRRASFYVLPENGRDDQFYDNGVPFDQDGLETRKLRFLARQGYEIGNHTTTHRNLYCLSARTLRWEMAAAVRYMHKQVPDIMMDTMALPYGVAPSDPYLWDTLLSGTDGGTPYRNHCILWADGGPAYPPTHRKFDPRCITRILPTPGNVEHWIATLKPGSATAPYVSDGDPNTLTVPETQQQEIAPDYLHKPGLKLRITQDKYTKHQTPEHPNTRTPEHPNT